LFVRSGRRLCLTEAGGVLLPLAEKMVSMAMHAQEVMVNLKGEVHGLLHVGCSTTPGKYILPKLLSKFIMRYPQVQASCQVHSRQEALRQLSQGKVHLALASTHEFDKDCEFYKLFEDQIVLIAPLDHPWARTGVAHLNDLPNARLISREEGSGTYGVVKQGLERAGMHIEDLTHPDAQQRRSDCAGGTRGAGSCFRIRGSGITPGIRKGRHDPGRRVERASPPGHLHRQEHAATVHHRADRLLGIRHLAKQPDQ